MEGSAAAWLVDCLTSVCLFDRGTPTNRVVLALALVVLSFVD
jgi:hypothetical protein